MLGRHIHVVQPYWVGTKDRKSLALIIPAQIAKEQNLNASTIFALRIDDKKKIILQVVSAKCEEEETMMSPADKSFQAPDQQVSSSGDQ
jgi:antitoxin component of MazEF toxin-antitoxin module